MIGKVSIHASTKDATYQYDCKKQHFQVSIHASTKDATPFHILQSNMQLLFQSTHPRRMRPFAKKSVNLTFLFQSTHPRRMRHYNKIYDVMHLAGFNPRIHEGCDFPHNVNIWNAKVSIHASTKDATLVALKSGVSSNVSIHASTKDATKEGYKRQCVFISFNPRIHEGCDWI